MAGPATDELTLAAGVVAGTAGVEAGAEGPMLAHEGTAVTRAPLLETSAAQIPMR